LAHLRLNLDLGSTKRLSHRLSHKVKSPIVAGSSLGLPSARWQPWESHSQWGMTIEQWVTLSFRNTKVLHQSVTSNLKSNCWTPV